MVTPCRSDPNRYDMIFFVGEGELKLSSSLIDLKYYNLNISDYMKSFIIHFLILGSPMKEEQNIPYGMTSLSRLSRKRTKMKLHQKKKCTVLREQTKTIPILPLLSPWKPYRVDGCMPLKKKDTKI